MTPSYARFLSLPILLATGCAGTFNPSTLVTGAKGEVPLLESGALQVSRLRELGRRDLACGDVAIERNQTGPIFRVQGCGKSRLYLRLATYDQAKPGEPSLAPEETIDFEPLTAHTEQAHRNQGQTELATLVRLNVQGAHDLECPRESVVPQMALAGFAPGHRAGRWHIEGPPVYAPFAEGCGRRATYVIGPTDPFVLSGKVDAPDSPSGFSLWDGVAEGAR